MNYAIETSRYRASAAQPKASPRIKAPSRLGARFRDWLYYLDGWPLAVASAVVAAALIVADWAGIIPLPIAWQWSFLWAAIIGVVFYFGVLLWQIVELCRREDMP